MTETPPPSTAQRDGGTRKTWGPSFYEQGRSWHSERVVHPVLCSGVPTAQPHTGYLALQQALNAASVLMHKRAGSCSRDTNYSVPGLASRSSEQWFALLTIPCSGHYRQTGPTEYHADLALPTQEDCEPSSPSSSISCFSRCTGYGRAGPLACSQLQAPTCAVPWAGGSLRIASNPFSTVRWA